MGLLSSTETYTTTGTKTSRNADPSIVPFNLNVNFDLSNGGSVSYKLQYTYDSFDSPSMTDASATWYDSTVIPAGTSASAAQQFTAPVTRVRAVIASLTGSLKMTMNQGMSTN